MKRGLLGWVWMWSAAAAAVVVAQTPTFRSRVDTVDVHVTVRDSAGRLVTNLQESDFELFDNGKPTDIAVFSGDRQPIAISLLLDRSGSIVGQAVTVLRAAESFINELLPDDRAAVNTLSYECQPLTNEQQKLYKILQTPLPMDLGSPIWSATDRTMTAMADAAGRRAILLFSDGHDAGAPFVSGSLPTRTIPLLDNAGPCRQWSRPSEATFPDVLRRSQRDGIMIYTVSVEDMQGRTNDDDLKTIAQRSGGERYKLKQSDELKAAFKRIADELHHQYLLGFVPAIYDGKLHEIDVRVKRPGLTIRARKSYVADRSDKSLSATSGSLPPVAPLTGVEIESAIKGGMARQKLQASCRASANFLENPVESRAYAEVVLEGPVGRIMRKAREAREQRRTFTAADVTDDMKRPVVQVTAELKNSTTPAELPAGPVTSDSQSTTGNGSGTTAGTTIDATLPPRTSADATPPNPKPAPSRSATPLMTLLVRSRLQTEYTVPPEYLPKTFPLIDSLKTLSAYFDLAAFRALPGPDVEIAVRSGAGMRYCTIDAKSRATIR